MLEREDTKTKELYEAIDKAIVSVSETVQEGYLSQNDYVATVLALSALLEARAKLRK